MALTTHREIIAAQDKMVAIYNALSTEDLTRIYRGLDAMISPSNPNADDAMLAICIAEEILASRIGWEAIEQIAA